MLSLAAAACAPLRMRSQKVSPGEAWVTMATVMRGVVALPAKAGVSPSSDFLPPELLEQPVANRAPTRTVAARVAARWCLCMSLAPHCAGQGDGNGKWTLMGLLNLVDRAPPGPAGRASGSKA